MPKTTGLEPALRISESLERVFAGEPVCIGTENRAKCQAVRQALETLRAAVPGGAGEGAGWADLRLVPVGVASGVPDQPVGFEEIVAGARNRARAARAAGGGVLAVGIEDGLVSLPDGRGPGTTGVFNFGCAWVTDGRQDGSGFSSGFAYPPACLAPAVQDRQPIGDLFDALWRQHRVGADGTASGADQGNIGRLTAGRLTRSDYGSHAVICALVRFLQRDLYD